MPPPGQNTVYEYSTKAVSAAADDSIDVVLGGTVNIRNPGKVRASIRKQLVIPGAGESRVFTEQLEPGAATRVTSQQMAKDYGMSLDGGFEGFLVVQSSVSLDVVTLYTVASRNGAGSAIKVVHVPERILAAAGKPTRGVTLEYSTKAVSAAADDSIDVVIGGTVNIRNPWTVRASIRKQVVIPGAGVSKVLSEQLEPGAATRVTSQQMAEDFGIGPEGGFEGFLVVQSNVSLDVVTLYTAGRRNGPVTALDVVHVPERKLVTV